MTEYKSYIEVVNLDFEYPDGTQALKEINLEIKKGEFIALIGQNGSGKTTLSKCLNGLYKPTAGDIVVDGLNSKDSSIVQMVKRVGYVFQNPDHQLFNNNCWDEIAYEIMDFLKDLNEKHGHTIIIITHDMPIVGRYARRVIAMAQARIMADGPTREVFTQSEVLEKTFLAPPQITQLAQADPSLGFDPGTLTVEEMVEQFLEIKGE
jgi:energy-coupling factor transporter ATP-binding protein EcfA2